MTTPITIKFYIDSKGRCPFQEWVEDLNGRFRAAVEIRIDRLAAGNPGQHRVLGGGLNELKMDLGPGLRVYYGHYGTEIVILLCGGDKSTQNKDIAKAKYFLEDYKRRKQ